LSKEEGRVGSYRIGVGRERKRVSWFNPDLHELRGGEEKGRGEEYAINHGNEEVTNNALCREEKKKTAVFCPHKKRGEESGRFPLPRGIWKSLVSSGNMGRGERKRANETLNGEGF